MVSIGVWIPSRLCRPDFKMSPMVTPFCGLVSTGSDELGGMWAAIAAAGAGAWLRPAYRNSDRSTKAFAEASGAGSSVVRSASPASTASAAVYQVSARISARQSSVVPPALPA